MNHTTINTSQKTSINPILYLLIASTVLLRGFLAWVIEFGNDEVYYYTYVLFPSISYFDHPGMVGWLSRITTFGLRLDSELFFRLPAVLLSGLNTYMMYKIGCSIKNERTGLYAAFLYTGSIYCSVICGVFFMPDAALATFYLLAIYLILNIFKEKTINPTKTHQMLLLGLLIGLAMLSKYHAVYLWGGVGLIILFGSRPWLLKWQLYAAIGITAITILPILVWNVQNDWISLVFHQRRVQFSELSVDFGAILRELFGGMAYHNPVNWILIVLALVFTFRGKLLFDVRIKWILLALGLPMIFVFMVISIFRDTLPHWSGVGYMSLLILSAVYLDQNYKGRIPVWIKASLTLEGVLLILALVQIKTGVLPIGSKDPTLDMYGWRQLDEKVDSLLDTKQMDGVRTMVSYRWFPGAHMDYYVARENGLKMLVLGAMDKIHQYQWINQYRGGCMGEDMLYLASENDFYAPEEVFEGMYDSYIELAPIHITRMGRVEKTYRVYLLKNTIIDSTNHINNTL